MATDMNMMTFGAQIDSLSFKKLKLVSLKHINIMDFLDKLLPNDLVLDIGSRVHHLNMFLVLEKIRDPVRVLASFVPIPSAEWMHFIDHDELECFPVPNESSKNYWALHKVFGQEIKHVFHISHNCIVGQMMWGAWFFLEIDIQVCFIASDINNFMSALPTSVHHDIFL